MHVSVCVVTCPSRPTTTASIPNVVTTLIWQVRLRTTEWLASESQRTALEMLSGEARAGASTFHIRVIAM